MRQEFQHYMVHHYKDYPNTKKQRKKWCANLFLKEFTQKNEYRFNPEQFKMRFAQGHYDSSDAFILCMIPVIDKATEIAEGKNYKHESVEFTFSETVEIYFD